MELVEEGALSLDDTVEQWAPGLLAVGHSITVRHLLGHTSGLPDYTKDENFVEAFVADEDLPPQRLVSFVSSEPLAFEPGTQYEYSDTDNIVLGMIVEAATRKHKELEGIRRAGSNNPGSSLYERCLSILLLSPNRRRSTG